MEQEATTEAKVVAAVEHVEKVEAERPKSPPGVPEPPKEMIPMFDLIRYSTRREKWLMALAALFSTVAGVLTPVVIVVLGDMLGGFGGGAGLSGGGAFDPVAYFTPTILKFVYFGIGMFFSAYFSNALWTYVSETQGRRIREKYVQAILRQDQGWFDASEEGSLTTRLASDTQNVQDGLGERVGQAIEGVASFIAGVIVALVNGWKLALVILSCTPVMALAGIVLVTALRRAHTSGQTIYASAGEIAEQAISGVRTVYAFSLQKRFINRYNHTLEGAMASDVMKNVALGTGIGFFMMTLFSIYGLGFWYGKELVLKGEMQGNLVLVVFFAMLLGLFALVTVPSSLSYITSARVSAFRIWATIERKPTINSEVETGYIPADGKLQGRITFEKVKFHYPTRPDVPILKSLDMEIREGKTVAFVGPSGSGKSTTVGLVQRFYDPIEGRVLIDGRDIKEYNIKWLRRQIGIVGQEPVLFDLTIKQNILLGTPEPVTYAKLVEVCKLANCYDFISKLPQKFDTNVGSMGGMLSGGQKQRIAIARAMIKNPKILLLDEATSALDTASEKIVQQALQKAAAGRTTVTIAHRLSTIRDADQIVVMAKGDIMEKGKHDELLLLKGIYHGLVEKQKIAQRLDTTATTKTDAHGEEEPAVAVAGAASPEAAGKSVSPASIDMEDPNAILQIEDAALLARLATARRIAEQKKSSSQSKRKSPLPRIISLMKGDYHLVIGGGLLSVLAGVAFPFYALCMALLIVLLISNNADVINNFGTWSFSVNFYCFMFVIIGIAAFIGRCFGRSALGLAGAKLTRKIRVMTFESYLQKEIGYFDLPGHSVGVLTSRLATDAANVNAAVTEAWGDFMALMGTIIAGLAIGFAYAPNLTGIQLLMTPIIVYSSWMRAQAIKGFEDKTKKAYEESCEVAAEAIREVKTVASLTRQVYFLEKYSAALEYPHKLGIVKAVRDSIGAGFEKSSMQFMNAVGFYAGIRLSMGGHIELQNLMVSIITVMITAQQIGMSSTFTSSLHKGTIAAHNIFEILDRKTEIDAEAPGKEPERDNFEPSFKFKDVAFRYPARPEQKIFEGEFKLEGFANKTLALVGPSGCGKSTTIGMLERWYDALQGDVSVGGVPIKEYQLKAGLRRNIALVGQEPTLFKGTIGENIKWGNDAEISSADMIEAAKMANIHAFVDELPQKYDTQVGDKGGQLSGGQKQRIAIARALARKPKLLLLDEATSALDSESEKKIQVVLDAAREGRTVLTIAHRLSTIQNADAIAVVSGGRVIELGTHQELLANSGLYADLVKQQDLSALQ